MAFYVEYLFGALCQHRPLQPPLKRSLITPTLRRLLLPGRSRLNFPERPPAGA